MRLRTNGSISRVARLPLLHNVCPAVDKLLLFVRCVACALSCVVLLVVSVLSFVMRYTKLF